MTFAEAFSDSIELLAATFDRREAENIVRILGEDFFQVYSLHSQKKYLMTSTHYCVQLQRRFWKVSLYNI